MHLHGLATCEILTLFGHSLVSGMRLLDHFRRDLGQETGITETRSTIA
jgi:hypothetical protein